MALRSGIVKSLRLDHLQVSQLQSLLLATGSPVSGKKIELLARLDKELAVPKLPPNVLLRDHGEVQKPQQRASTSQPACHRILSIDLGLRNFAYCILELPLSSDAAPLVVHNEEARPRSKTGTATEPKSVSEAAKTKPVIVAWDRMALLDEEERANGTSTCRTAIQLMKDLVLEPPDSLRPAPQTVLLEQQRWRTGGASSVTEWTIRVNTLESMLYMGLQLARDRNLWPCPSKDDTGTGIWRVSPRQVLQWCFKASQSSHDIDLETSVKSWPRKLPASSNDDEIVAETTRKTATARATTEDVKRLKIDMLGRMCEEGRAFEVQGQARAMHDAFMRRWQQMVIRRDAKGSKGKADSQIKARTKVASEPSAHLHKIDDLADCVLQGLAWVDWEDQRRRLVSRGVEALQ